MMWNQLRDLQEEEKTLKETGTYTKIDVNILSANKKIR